MHHTSFSHLPVYDLLIIGFENRIKFLSHFLQSFRIAVSGVLDHIVCFRSHFKSHVSGVSNHILNQMCLVFQITCALVEVFQVEEMEEQVKKNYHRLFTALMVRIGSSVGVEPLKPAVVGIINLH